MEGFLGSNIKETGVPFDINRKLTKAEIEETIKYCRHDVEQTIKIFLEKIDEFNAMHGIVQAFPNMVSLSNIGDSEARITAKVLGCVKQDFKDEFDYFFLPCLRLNKYKYVQDWFEEKKKEALAMDLQNCDKYDKNYGTSHRTLKLLLRVYHIHLVLVVCMVQQIHQYIRPGRFFM